MGGTVTLDGTGSAGYSGHSLTYLWTQTSSSIALSDPTQAGPTFSTPAVNHEGDTLTFLLTVQDENNGLTDTDEVSVAVLPDPVAA